jgi:biopolymer transport protein ExbB/TolQ
MEDFVENEGLNIYFSTTLHQVAQVLMMPVMLALVLLIVFALYCIGSLIAEIFTERRHFKANVPRIINDVHDAAWDAIEPVIVNAALLKPQKQALLMAVRNMGLTDDDLFALAKTEISKVDDRYKRILSRTDLVTKIAPMMGLMCTLIPLGPGIVAMGQGEVNQLSTSLLIAFDGTVAGLLAAVVSLVISGIRKRWYLQYITTLEALMTTVLDKAAVARKEGVELPHDYWQTPTATNSKTVAGEATSARSLTTAPAATAQAAIATAKTVVSTSAIAPTAIANATAAPTSEGA